MISLPNLLPSAEKQVFMCTHMLARDQTLGLDLLDKCLTLSELCAYVCEVVLFWDCFHQSLVLSLELLRKD